VAISGNGAGIGSGTVTGTGGGTAQFACATASVFCFDFWQAGSAKAAIPQTANPNVPVSNFHRVNVMAHLATRG
jgi:hypothetical protein